MNWDIPPLAMIENIFTLFAIVCIVLGLYSMGAGWLSFVGLLLMFNLNGTYPVTKTDDKEN